MNLQLLAEEGGVSVVTLTGEISQIRFRTGDNPFEALLGLEGFGRTVLLDGREAEWIDSSGISWLIASHKRFAADGGCLVLYQLPPRVHGVLQFCKIDGVLNVAGDRDAARGMAEHVLRGPHHQREVLR
jgi:anti-anti-sigma factor